jgi:UDP-N-acetylmuramyl pentapeptide synthase
MALRLVLDRRVEALRAGPLGRLALLAGIATARTYRPALPGVRFVGVTGTAGKTTTKDLVVAVLAPRLAVTRTPGSRNRYSAVGRTVLATRPWHDACVVEVATAAPGDIARVARLIRPALAVVTVVGMDHQRSFATLEEIAAEKGDLVAALPPDGVAILNADDPLVLGMGARTQARILTYGSSAGAELRAEAVRASWPATLAFTLHYGGRAYPVATRFFGRQALPGVLAALAVAVAVDLPLEDAIDAVARFEPLPGRMSLVRAGGVSFVRDDLKAPLWGMDAVFEFLGEAQAPRKRLVLGGVTNARGARARVYRQLIRQGLEVADEVIVAGAEARYAVGLADAGLPVRACLTVREAADYLRETARDGDLVVLKGDNEKQHGARMALAQIGEVRCWREQCGRRVACDACSLLRIPAGG